MIIVYLIFINLFGLLIMGYDKINAINNRWRISEKCIFLITLIGGGIGTTLGMYFFHHKTRKILFKIFLPLITIIEYLGGLL